MTPEMGELLRSRGVYVVRGMGVDPATGALFSYPLVALYHDTKTPTPEEVGLLGEAVQRRAGRFLPGEIHDFTVEGANTAIFRKVDAADGGRWTFRKLTWTRGPTWYPKPGALREIIAEAIR